MKWQLEKHTLDEIIKLVRRVVKYQESTTNEDTEIVQFSNDISVYESYFEEREKYPVVVVTSLGGSFFNNSINDYITTLSQDLYNTQLGTVPDSYCTIDNNTLYVPIPDSLISSDDQLAGFMFNYSWTGRNVGNDDINYNVYSNYPSSSVIVASGSVSGTDSLFMSQKSVVFPSNIQLSSGSYCISMSSSLDSPYYVFMDSTFDSTYTIDSTEYSGSIVGELLYPPFVRLGGRFEGSLTIRTLAKNSSAAARNLSELIALKLLLFKQLHYDRTSTDFVKSPMIFPDVNPEWFDKDIIIKSVRSSPIEVRKRGSNDNIFIQSIAVDYITHWYIDIPVDYLSNIDISVFTF